MAISTQATTATTTIEIEIKQDEHGHGWTIDASDSRANEQRFGEVQGAFNDKRKNRHPKKPSDHTPIVFNEGDTLRFSGPQGLASGIGAKKNPDVDDFPGAPDNPFGWDGMQIVPANGSVSGVVTRSSGETPGVKDQAFYKFHGWVRLADGTFVAVDPDGYCGG
jgi:hypothetical protein